MIAFLTKHRRTIIFGILIFIVGLAVRVYRLTSLPIFADEAIYLRWAQVMRAEPTLRFLPLSDGKQPLFMWVVMIVLKFFDDPLVATRFVSVLAGLGSLIGVSFLTFLLFNSKRTALIASFLYAISPFAVFFDRIGLVDSMLSMFGIWVLFFGLLTAKTRRLDLAMITGFILGAAFLTKSSALFFAIMLPGTLIFSKKKVVTGLLFIPTFLIAGAMYNILRLGPNFDLLKSRSFDYVLPLSHIWTGPLDPFILYFDRVVEWYWRIGPGLLIVFVALGTVLVFKKYKRELLILWIWFLVPILVQSMYAKAFTTRYVLFSLPFVIVAASSIFLATRKWRRFAVLGLVVLFFQAVSHNYFVITDVESASLPNVMRSGYLEEWTAGTGIREISETIREEYHLNPNRKIIVGTEGYFGTLPDAMQIFLADLPEITVIGVGLDFTTLPSQLRTAVERKGVEDRVYLVVNKSRMDVDPKKLGLDLLAAYPKALRREGTKEYITKGPQEVLYLYEVKGSL